MLTHNVCIHGRWVLISKFLPNMGKVSADQPKCFTAGGVHKFFQLVSYVVQYVGIQNRLSNQYREYLECPTLPQML